MAYLIRAVQASVIGIIKLYQWCLSPFLGSCCRFYPSCSSYAITAVTHFGVVKGLWIATRRLLRCHPWSRGGFDPVVPDLIYKANHKEENHNGN